MDQCERLKLILQESKLKQKDFASELGISAGYVSQLLKDPDIRLSKSLASLIEVKYGYNADWVLNGEGPKIKQVSNKAGLSEFHQKALLRLEKMNDDQVKAVLAFINALEDVEKILLDDVGSDKSK